MLILLKSTKAPFSMFVTVQLWRRMRLKPLTPLKAPLSMLSKVLSMTESDVTSGRPARWWKANCRTAPTLTPCRVMLTT